MYKIKIEVRDYLFVKEIIESYENEEILKDFLNKFEVGKEINYNEYYNFCYDYIDDMSEIYYINNNWNDEYDDFINFYFS
jgi:ribosome assembly protein YihI (activator of Der GTPase)